MRLAENKILPNLILLDINMPVMDGWDFLNELQKIEEGKNIPVVLITSSVDNHDIEKAKTYAQIKGYFTKPLPKEGINDILELLE